MHKHLYAQVSVHKSWYPIMQYKLQKNIVVKPMLFQ